jgi:hypothetical protein
MTRQYEASSAKTYSKKKPITSKFGSEPSKRWDFGTSKRCVTQLYPMGLFSEKELIAYAVPLPIRPSLTNWSFKELI